jgi:hypothetical protein
MSKSYAIIKHQILGEISDDEVLKHLPQEEGIPKYKIFDIKKTIINMDAIHTLDSFEFRIYQKNFMETEVKPYLAENPDCNVLYFGTSTIPLALHLGYCFGSWKDVNVHLLHREDMSWTWTNTNEGEELPTESSFVQEEFGGPINVIYKVEATYLTQETELKESVEGISKIIGLNLKEIGKDVFQNQYQLKAFAHQFSLGIDSIANYLPNTDKIHLFPTVPVGLAFLMGTKINPTITKPIVAYQYNTNHSPKYEQILILQESAQQEENISEADQQFINEVKAELKNEIEIKIRSYVNTKVEEKRKYNQEISWIKFVLPEGSYSEIENSYWKSIPDIAETILGASTISSDTNYADEGFYISEGNEWQINDRFIFNIKNRLDGDKHKILRALRMFIFHESLHIYQALTNHTARNIGRFPRVLEEADYIADVWAMIHEYSYSVVHYANETSDAKTFFKDLIDIASKTMWAFDDLDPNNEEMQIRRVNRYLFWYWNYLQIEDRNCKNLEDIVRILANKPILEIRGLDIRAQAQRTIFKLSNYKLEELELGYIDMTGKIKRTSNSGGIQLDELIKGFKERNGEKILRQLKSWFHQIR